MVEKGAAKTLPFSTDSLILILFLLFFSTYRGVEREKKDTDWINLEGRE